VSPSSSLRNTAPDLQPLTLRVESAIVLREVVTTGSGGVSLGHGRLAELSNGAGVFELGIRRLRFVGLAVGSLGTSKAVRFRRADLVSCQRRVAG
jgi:hypothetical protein